MMISPLREPRVSVDEYLQGELISEIRHEYVAGGVYAMVGASDRHNLIAGNLFAAVRPGLRNTGCQIFMADMKLRLQTAGDDLFYYPDLMVVCDPDDRDTYFRTRPCLIVEVLSSATERVDRREKLLAYTSIDSLQAYVLLSQDEYRAEVFRRDNGWRAEYPAEGELTLPCANVKIPMEVIYEEVLPVPEPDASRQS